MCIWWPLLQLFRFNQRMVISLFQHKWGLHFCTILAPHSELLKSVYSVLEVLMLTEVRLPLLKTKRIWGVKEMTTEWAVRGAYVHLHFFHAFKQQKRNSRSHWFPEKHKGFCSSPPDCWVPGPVCPDASMEMAPEDQGASPSWSHPDPKDVLKE